MKIIFDHKIFFLQKYGGISSYYINLIENLNKINKENYIVSPLHKNIYLKNKDFKFNCGYYVKYIPSKINFFINKYNTFRTNLALKKIKPDIIHETYYEENNSYKKFKGVRFCTVFDMITEKFPKLCFNSKKNSLIKKKTIERSDHIFCISETTKKDLIEIFNVDKKKITVTLLASTIPNEKTINKNKFFSDCILYVGSRQGYKNFDGLLAAFNISSFLKKNFRIIAFGGEPPSLNEIKNLKKYNMLKNVIFLNDKDFNLNFLYQNVRAFVFPSIYEGFGLPLLEAMSLNCPIISSNGGSLKEVGGDGLIYFDPRNINNMSKSLEDCLASDELINKQILYGKIRLQNFSWKKCAELTLEMYNKMIN